MRQIRFRAWDGKKMWQVHTLDLMSDIGTHFNHDGLKCTLLDDPVLMQFTGLKDKNGVDIYEGDILEVELDKNNLIRIEVVYQTDYASFSGSCHKTGVYYDISFRKSPLTRKEVIGNIYQNTELLKENDK